MKKAIHLIFLAAMLFTLSGCVEQQQNADRTVEQDQYEEIEHWPQSKEIGATEGTEGSQPIEVDNTPELPEGSRFEIRFLDVGQTSEEMNDTVGNYIGNINSKKVHLPSCHTLPAEKNQVYFDTREEAINSGYSPCGNCNP